jgi:hypothetical protein
MNRNSPVPLWAVLSIVVVALVSVYFLGQSRLPKPEEGLAVNRPSTTRFPSATSSPTIAAFEATVPTRTVAGEYINTYYGYSFRIPDGWRLAEKYMRAWNATIPLDAVASELSEYVVLTSASVDEETEFLSTATSVVGNHDFAPGRTIFVQPGSQTVDVYRDQYTTIGTERPVTLRNLTLGEHSGLHIDYEPVEGTTIEMIVMPCSSVREVRSTHDTMASVRFRGRQTVVPAAESQLLQVASTLMCKN